MALDRTEDSEEPRQFFCHWYDLFDGLLDFFEAHAWSDRCVSAKIKF
jgi:hypothetical protein